jgi:two-component system phosphate regulon sensor histidine kinase PhoR
MNEFRYKRLLIVQALLLLLWGAFQNQLLHNAIKESKYNNLWSSYWFYWVCFIVINVLFLYFFALPSKKIMKTVSPDSSPEDLSWAMIEEKLLKKDQELLTLQQSWEQENLKYQTLLDSLLDPVFIFNDDLSVSYANQAFLNYFKFPLENIPSPMIEISRHLDFQEILKTAQKTDHPVKISSFTFSQLQDPHKIFYEIKIFPMKNTRGHLCLLHDITQMKMADLMREDFVANFSHEVRTPLTILNGQLQNLKQTISPDKEIDENKLKSIFERIDNNSRRLINLFNDLLRLTSVEKKIELQKEEVDITQLIETLCDELSVNYPDKKITFEYDFKVKIFLVDYNLFEQVLINLIDNAFKYIPTMGTIGFKTYLDDKEPNALLEITDNGIGIPEDQVYRIFERFFRVDISRSSEIQGTGLGLAIVKHIIIKHEGKIKAVSSQGQGTTFTIAIPISN